VFVLAGITSRRHYHEPGRDGALGGDTERIGDARLDDRMAQ
jgi:hypothetical protein